MIRDLSAMLGQRDAMLVMLAGLAAFTSALVVTWPYVVGDRRADRLRRIREERDQVKRRGRLAAPAGKATLKQQPMSPVDQFFARLRGLRTGDYADLAEVFHVARMLRTAGYRDQRAVFTYLAMQMMTPVALAALAALWLYGVMEETPPAVTQAAALLAAAVAGYFAPRIFIENKISKRRQAILRTWPDALDLMLICVEAGMTSEVALGRVAEEMAAQSPDLASELNLTTAELAYLQDRATAWRNLGDRTGLHTVRAVVTSLMQSEKYGTSLAATLRVVAQEQRDARLLEAEKKAAALPPKLTVPMILFFLPVLFVVILVPAVIRLMGVE